MKYITTKESALATWTMLLTSQECFINQLASSFQKLISANFISTFVLGDSFSSFQELKSEECASFEQVSAEEKRDASGCRHFCMILLSLRASFCFLRLLVRIRSDFAVFKCHKN